MMQLEMKIYSFTDLKHCLSFQPKLYEMNVHSYSLLQKPAGDPTYFKIAAQCPHGTFSAIDDGLIRDVNENKEFAIKISDIGSNSCLSVDYNDGTLEYYGKLQDCLDVYPNMVKDQLAGNIELNMK